MTMTLDAQTIAKEVEDHVAKHAAAPNIPQDFCKIWPTAKPILELVANGVVFIPTAGAIAGAALQALIKIGDDVAAQVCKPTP